MPDIGITGDVVSCVKRIVGAGSECKECVESLVCCVTDSCKYINIIKGWSSEINSNSSYKIDNWGYDHIIFPHCLVVISIVISVSVSVTVTIC